MHLWCVQDVVMNFLVNKCVETFGKDVLMQCHLRDWRLLLSHVKIAVSLSCSKSSLENKRSFIHLYTSRNSVLEREECNVRCGEASELCTIKGVCLSTASGSQPRSTVRRRAVQPRQWSGTKMVTALRRTETTHAPIVCCCPVDPFSFYASSMDDGASQMMAATSAWPETIWARRSVIMHPWK
ncbi:hypothetical protein XENOCAPTIV_015349 [Xenoophorus captivus]|uniref:Uncharacterized protein n=1 Tax=Xenoophorus captivus TaxID=1517983 RepID=A0ABV0S131_9TELE